MDNEIRPWTFPVPFIPTSKNIQHEAIYAIPEDILYIVTCQEFFANVKELIRMNFEKKEGKKLIKELQPLCFISHWITEGCPLYMEDILKTSNYKRGNLIWQARRFIKAEIQRTPLPWDVELNQDAIFYIEKLQREGLNERNYKEYLLLLLFAEENAQLMELLEWNCREITPYKYQEEKISFQLKSILDDCPRLQVGSIIYLTSIEDCGKSFLTQVTKIEEDKVTVKVEKGLIEASKLTIKNKQSFSVDFVLDTTTLCCSRRAILNSTPELISRLFPKVDTIPVQEVPDLKEGDIFDKSIAKNKEQLQAVKYILAGYSFPYPYILFGPPGTGKTMTLVESIKQVFFQKRDSTIIVAAQSNSATDLLAQRLVINEDFTKGDIIRVYSHTLKYIHVVPWELTNCHQFGASRKKLKQYRIVCMTLTMCTGLRKQGFKASHIFVDEAAQASEPDLLMAFAGNLKEDGQIILAGDHFQLGPVVKSSNAKELGLEKSPMERLMGYPLYKKKKKYGFNPMVVTKLLDNYRSHKDLLTIPNQLFYENELRYCAKPETVNDSDKLTWLPKKGFPVMFHNIRHRFEKEYPCRSLFNKGEEDMVLKYTEDVLSSGIDPEHLGIITPYKKHRRNIKKSLKRNYDDHEMILVGSTEEFQGQERSVIILSTARSSISPNGKPVNNLGFLTSPKRFNVSITRAKSLLIVVGDAFLLYQNPLWKKLIKFCKSEGTFTGEPHSSRMQMKFERSMKN